MCCLSKEESKQCILIRVLFGFHFAGIFTATATATATITMPSALRKVGRLWASFPFEVKQYKWMPYGKVHPYLPQFGCGEFLLVHGVWSSGRAVMYHKQKGYFSISYLLSMVGGWTGRFCIDLN